MKRRKAHGKPNVHGATIQMLQEKRINTVEKILSISDCGELILSTLRMPQCVVRISYPFGFFHIILVENDYQLYMINQMPQMYSTHLQHPFLLDHQYTSYQQKKTLELYRDQWQSQVQCER